MNISVSADIRERERINETFFSFLMLSYWTPAMGALLIAGVVPVLDCLELPSSGSSIVGVAVAASPRQLSEAKSAMERWDEWRLDREERASKFNLSSHIPPYDFLAWCAGDYQDEPDGRKPSWLNYLLALIEYKQNGDAPFFAPAAIVNNAADLDRFSTVINEKIYVAQPHALNSFDSKKFALCNNIAKNSRVSIKAEIISAIQNSQGPLAIGAIWFKLREMAISENYPVLRYEKSVVKVPVGDDGWKTYSRATLGQFLRRHDSGIEE